MTRTTAPVLRMRACLLAVCLLTFSATSARSQDADAAPSAPPPSAAAPKEPDLRAARDLAAEALAALRAGDAKRAADLWEQASAAAPDEPSLRFNRGVALEAAGDRRAAVDAYEDALSAGRASSGDTASRSQFNLAALELEQAWGARDLMQMGGEEWKAALREQLAAAGGPDAELSDEEIAARSEQLRLELAKKGVESARSATKRLRDLIRSDPTDRDVATNLELAQRTVRELREELEKQKQQDKDDSGEKSDEKSDDEQEQNDQDKQSDDESDGDQEKQDQDDNDGEKKDGEDEQQKPEDNQEDKQDGDEKRDQKEKPEASQDESEKKPSDARQEKAEKMLEDLLDAAARRADEVRKLRAERARRAPVERDW